MAVPRPSDAFCTVVERELAEARERIDEILKKKEVAMPIGVPSKLTNDKVRELHARVLAGETLRAISNEVWQEYGYMHSDSCQSALVYRFRRLGLNGSAPAPDREPEPQPDAVTTVAVPITADMVAKVLEGFQITVTIRVKARESHRN